MDATLALNQFDQAEADLRAARAEAEAIGTRRMPWKILAALSEIADRRGNLTESRALRDQARSIVDFVADHCPPDLRSAFLTLPDVQSVTRDYRTIAPIHHEQSCGLSPDPTG